MSEFRTEFDFDRKIGESIIIGDLFLYCIEKPVLSFGVGVGSAPTKRQVS